MVVEGEVVTMEEMEGMEVQWVGDHSDGSKRIREIEDKPKGKVTLDDGCVSATLSFLPHP